MSSQITRPDQVSGTGAHPNSSIIYNILIVFGIVATAFGAFTAVLGVGAPTAFTGEIGQVKVETTSVGLVIFAICFGGTIYAATHPPSGITILEADALPTWLQWVPPNAKWIRDHIVPALIVLGAGLAALIISLILTNVSG